MPRSRVTVGTLFANAASLFPERIALADGSESVTYRELDRRVNRAANALAARGMRPGERVALLAENSIEHVVLMLACAKAGVILACQNWRLTPTELAHCLRLVEPSLVVGSERYMGLLVDAEAPLGVECLETDFRAAATPAPDTAPASVVDPEAPLLILYTSGTTGLPKGAVISHRAEIARNMVLRGEFGLAPTDTFVCWTPLHHMGGADHALGNLMVGGKVIVLDGFDVERLAALTATMYEQPERFEAALRAGIAAAEDEGAGEGSGR